MIISIVSSAQDASLLDLLNPQSDDRVVQLAYRQWIGSYLTAAGQLNPAVGRERIPDPMTSNHTLKTAAGLAACLAFARVCKEI